MQDYLKDELNDILSQSTATNIRLKTELSNFLTSIENRKNDNERNAIGQTITEATEANIGANDLMTKHRRKRFLGIER